MWLLPQVNPYTVPLHSLSFFFCCPIYDHISPLDGFLFIFSLEPIEETLLKRYGFPEAGSETRCYTNHALSYDQAKRVPRWVIEHLSKQKMLGT